MVEAVEKSGLVEISMFARETGTTILKVSTYHQEPSNHHETGYRS